MGQTTLMEVLIESLRDDSFRQQLLSQHRDALESRKYDLSPEDMKKLEDFLSGNQVADPETILNTFSDVMKGTAPPPPPPWQPEMD